MCLIKYLLSCSDDIHASEDEALSVHVSLITRFPRPDEILPHSNSNESETSHPPLQRTVEAFLPKHEQASTWTSIKNKKKVALLSDCWCIIVFKVKTYQIKQLKNDFFSARYEESLLCLILVRWWCYMRYMKKSFPFFVLNKSQHKLQITLAYTGDRHLTSNRLHLTWRVHRLVKFITCSF